MGVNIYGSMQSTCTQRVVLLLKELDVNFEFSEISMQKGEHKNEHYLKHFHPFGRLPALEDDGLRLFESRAICRYLVAKYGKSHILNFDRVQRTPSEIGKWEQVVSVEYSYFDPSVKALAYELIFKKLMGHGDPDADQVSQQKALLADTMNYYETILNESSYLTGSEFSLVDLYHMPWLQELSTLGLETEISSRPAVKSWCERISSRPSWQDLLKLL